MKREWTEFITSEKRGNAGEKNIKNNTGAPNIYFLSISSEQDFRRNVVSASDDFPIDLTIFNENGQSEIRGFDLRHIITGGHEEILRFEISMHDAHEMTDVNYIDYLSTNPRSFLLGVASFLQDPVEKLPAGAQFHDQMHVPVVLIRAVKLHDVGLTGKML